MRITQISHESHGVTSSSDPTQIPGGLASVSDTVMLFQLLSRTEMLPEKTEG